MRGFLWDTRTETIIQSLYIQSGALNENISLMFSTQKGMAFLGTQKRQNRACIHENELAHWKNGFKHIPLGTDKKKLFFTLSTKALHKMLRCFAYFCTVHQMCNKWLNKALFLGYWIFIILHFPVFKVAEVCQMKVPFCQYSGSHDHFSHIHFRLYLIPLMLCRR